MEWALVMDWTICLTCLNLTHGKRRQGDTLGSASEFTSSIEDGDAMMATSQEEGAVAVFDDDDAQSPEEIVNTLRTVATEK